MSMPLNTVELRNFVARALITNQALGAYPQYMEDIYANVQEGESYIDQIDGLADFAEQRGLETRDVKNTLTHRCFHKNYFDKRNPDNPYPWRNIFRDVSDDSQYVASDTDTNVETIDEPPLEVDHYLEQSMAGVGISDAYLGDNIVGPSSHATHSTRRPESAALRSPSSQVRHRYTVQSTPKNRQRVANKSLSLSGAKRSRDGGSISPMPMRNSNTSPMPTRRLAYSSAPSPPTSTSELKTYDKFAGKMIDQMNASQDVVRGGIKDRTPILSGKDLIDSSNPTLPALKFVNDPNGVVQKYNSIVLKHELMRKLMSEGDEIAQMNVQEEIVEMNLEVMSENSHPSLLLIKKHIATGILDCKGDIKSNESQLKQCEVIISKSDRNNRMTSQEASVDKTKLLQELKKEQEAELKRFEDLKEAEVRAEVEQFKEGQLAYYNRTEAELGKKVKDTTSRINQLNNSIHNKVVPFKETLEKRIKQQNENLENGFVVESAYVAVVETGLKCFGMALAGGKAQRYLDRYLKMQEAYQSGDLKRMKKDILDVVNGKEASKNGEQI